MPERRGVAYIPAERQKILTESFQRTHHAVDLRVPGISRNEYPHDENLRVR